jgi:hypothetical protein
VNKQRIIEEVKKALPTTNPLAESGVIAKQFHIMLVNEQKQLKRLEAPEKPEPQILVPEVPPTLKAPPSNSLLPMAPCWNGGKSGRLGALRWAKRGTSFGCSTGG